jgi:hypothetical protein
VLLRDRDGPLWAIFAFAMDQVFGRNMLEPMLGDPSGRTYTTWDLIVDALEAALIRKLGWWNSAKQQTSFLDA